MHIPHMFKTSPITYYTEYNVMLYSYTVLFREGKKGKASTFITVAFLQRCWRKVGWKDGCRTYEFSKKYTTNCLDY